MKIFSLYGPKKLVLADKTPTTVYFSYQMQAVPYSQYQNYATYTGGNSLRIKYAQILKNSVAFKETANERIFVMKDLVAVEEAVGLGAKPVEDAISF